MDVLLVMRNRLHRDQIKVGLQQFPEFAVTWGEGYAAINEVRQRHYDCIFIGIEFPDQEGFKLLQHLRSFNRSTKVVVVTGERHARDLAAEKSRLNIAAFLHVPIDAREFFRLVGRLRARQGDSDAAWAVR